MANIHNDLNSLFSAVADSIRTKKESTEKIIADNFPDEIRNLKTRFDYVNPMVTYIANSQFKNCEGLRSVNCENLVSIGASAFEGCAEMKEIIIPKSVTNIGENAFNECNCIIYCKADNIPETWNENWNPDNCLVLYGEPVETWDISATENDNVTAILYNDNNGLYGLSIIGTGDMISWEGYNLVPWYKSYRMKIANVFISNGVTNIGHTAFYQLSNLTSIIIPDSITRIGDSAFNGCNNLTSVYITSITKWLNILFEGNNHANPLQNGEKLFIGDELITNIIVPNTITTIGNSAFYGCKYLTSITIPDSVTSIGEYAFSDCSGLTSITIPDSVTSIDGRAFSRCTNLTSIIIPDGVTSIGAYTFSNCSGLTSITIPDSVTSIGEYALYRCSNLVHITYTGTVAKWKTIKFITYWNDDTGDYIIHCIDGDIARNGTITYHENSAGEVDA